MAEPVHTRLHHMIEGARKSVGPAWTAQMQAALDDLLKTPHYIVTPEVLKLLSTPQVQSSIQAMQQAKVARLPFEEVLMEIPLSSPGEGDVTVLSYMSQDASGLIHARNHYWSEDGKIANVSPDMRVELHDDGTATLSMNNLEESKRGLDSHHVKTLTWALHAALLMLNTQGIEKRVVEHTKINKRREASGKTRVPTYSVLRIGTIYDKSGKGHSITGTGRHMPVHLRAGHVRMQRYGKGWASHKQIYIPPVLVNFKPGDDVPTPHKLVKL